MSVAAVAARPRPPRAAGPRQVRRPTVRAVAGWLLLAVIVVVWAFALRPTQLGGPATYIVVSGDSMEPTMSDGDLVMLRERDSYDIGDIITFEVPGGEPGAGTLVIHRIVDTAGDAFIPQGDNRDQVDEWRPTQETIRGSLLFHVPRGGEILMTALQPTLLAALAGGGAAMWVLLRDPRTDRKDANEERS